MGFSVKLYMFNCEAHMHFFNVRHIVLVCSLFKLHQFRLLFFTSSRKLKSLLKLMGLNIDVIGTTVSHRNNGYINFIDFSTHNSGKCNAQNLKYLKLSKYL